MKIEWHRKIKDLLDTATYIKDIKGENFFNISSLIEDISKVYEDFYQYDENFIENFIVQV